MTEGIITSHTPSSRASTPTSSANAFSSLRRALSIAEQTPDLSRVPINANINELPPIRIGNKRYLKEDWLHTKRKRRSWIGDHGTYLVEINTDFERLKTFWSCNHCDENKKYSLYVADSTNAPTAHLKSEHRLHEQDESEETGIRLPNVLMMQRKAAKGALVRKPRVEAFKTLLLQWVVDQNISLTAVESELFRDLLTMLSSEVDTFLPRSGDTVHSWLMNAFQAKKRDIKRQLKEDALSKIHLSFDLWTSPNQLALLGIVAHYLDRKTWKNQSRLLALRRLRGSHSGENMASILTDVAQEYEITENFGFFTIDNAESNDTCLQTFLSSCFPDITLDAVKQRRLRCWGHVLNLSAKAFLFGKNADAFEVEHDTNVLLGREEAELAIWRKHGPIGKLHNVVVFIRRTPQRRELFIKISNLEEPDFATFMLNQNTKNLGVRQDNATRWNSTYLMIIRALQKRDEIDSFIARCEREKEAYKRVPAEDHLSSDDWLILAETASILKPFYTLTMRLQSRAKDAHHGAIWEVLPAMELILDHMEDMKKVYRDYHEPQDVDLETLPPAQSTRRRHRRQPAPPFPIDDINEASRKHLRTAINNAWEKLDYYYRRTDETPVYLAALVLHPGQKWKYVEDKWAGRQEWVEPAQRNIQSFYESYWQRRETTDIHTAQPTQSALSHELDEFEAWVTPHNYYASQAVAVDDYEAYISSPAIPVSDVIGWWRDHQITYPKLSQMAFDILSIPAMSAECERIFSLAKLIITSQRHGLSDLTIEAIQCMKNWLDRNAILLI